MIRQQAATIPNLEAFPAFTTPENFVVFKVLSETSIGNMFGSNDAPLTHLTCPDEAPGDVNAFTDFEEMTKMCCPINNTDPHVQEDKHTLYQVLLILRLSNTPQFPMHLLLMSLPRMDVPCGWQCMVTMIGYVPTSLGTKTR